MAMIVGKVKLLLAGRERFRGNVNPSLSIMVGRLLPIRSSHSTQIMIAAIV